MVAKRTAFYVVAVAAFLCSGMSSGQVYAGLITFTIPAGTTVGGQPVSATATITTSNDTIDVTLQNTQANPTSVIQALSDLFITFDNAQVAGSLTSSSSMERTIADDGTFTNGATVSTGWQVDDITSGGLRLHVLGTPIAPAHLIIGPPDGSNLYSNANGSIAGNKPHNPFLAESATFELNVPGVSADTTITGVTFSFGTTEGNNVTVGGGPPPVPEPASIVLAGLGVVGFASYRRLSRRAV
jgi:hypothetical protein